MPTTFTQRPQPTVNWSPNTTYGVGKRVVAPTGDMVTCDTNHISGATFSFSAGWQLTSSVANIMAQSQPNAFSPMRFGGKGGAVDDTEAVQLALNAAAASTSYPGGVVFLGDHTITQDVDIKRPRARVVGGRLRGGGISISRQVEDGGIADLDTVIDGVVIDRGSIVTGRHAITLFRVGRVRVVNSTFLNCDKVVNIPTHNAFHHVRRITFANNHAENYNYAWYNEVDPGLNGNGFFGVGDVTFHDNYLVGAKLTHFYARGLDGLVAHDNTMFFAADLTTKLRHYDLSVTDWVNIHDEHLFESGRESILIDHSRNFKIHDNNIAWPGQAVPSSGILVTGGGVEGESLIAADISHNGVNKPTKHGIEIQAPAQQYTVSVNTVIGAGSPDHYIGTDPIAGTNFGVVTPVGGLFANVFGNMTPQNQNSLGFTGSSGEHNGHFAGNVESTTPNRTFEKAMVQATGSTIDAAQGFRRITLNYAAATNISVITSAFSGQEIKLCGQTANATIVHNAATIALKGGVNATIPVDGMLTLYYHRGKWIEQARNF
jgi:hypothetical protein